MANWGKRAHALILDIADVLQEERLARVEDSMTSAHIIDALADLRDLVSGYLRDYALLTDKPFDRES